MVRPNFIPRTLKGVGGKRYLDIPGVIYPEKILRIRPGYNPKDGKPYQEAPEWGISSREAAAILKCTSSAARAMLHQSKVPFRVVMDGKSPKKLYWNREAVLRVAGKRKPMVTKVSPRLVDSREALAILGRGRTALHRFTESGKLHPLQVRSSSESGVRLRNYYLRAEVVKLKHYLRAMEVKESELRLLAQEHKRASLEAASELQRLMQSL